jgi:hypothetical protein
MSQIESSFPTGQNRKCPQWSSPWIFYLDLARELFKALQLGWAKTGQ